MKMKHLNYSLATKEFRDGYDDYLETKEYKNPYSTVDDKNGKYDQGWHCAMMHHGWKETS